MINIQSGVSKITQLYKVQSTTTTTPVITTLINSIPYSNPIGFIKGVIKDNGTPAQFPCIVRCYSDATGRLVNQITTTTPNFKINGLVANDRYTCIVIDQTRRFKTTSLSDIIPK